MIINVQTIYYCRNRVYVVTSGLLSNSNHQGWGSLHETVNGKEKHLWLHLPLPQQMQISFATLLSSHMKITTRNQEMMHVWQSFYMLWSTWVMVSELLSGDVIFSNWNQIVWCCLTGANHWTLLWKGSVSFVTCDLFWGCFFFFYMSVCVESRGLTFNEGTERWGITLDKGT